MVDDAIRIMTKLGLNRDSFLQQDEAPMYVNSLFA